MPNVQISHKEPCTVNATVIGIPAYLPDFQIYTETPLKQQNAIFLTLDFSIQNGVTIKLLNTTSYLMERFREQNRRGT